MNAGPEGSYLWSHRYIDNAWENKWGEIAAPLEISRGERHQIRFSVKFSFKNVSDSIARIDIVNTAGGSFRDHPDSSMPSLVIPPREEQVLIWDRYWMSEALSMEKSFYDPESDTLRMFFHVRDQGLNVRDTYEFLANLRFFTKDGSRLTVNPHQASLRDESSATPVPGRVYERLEDEHPTDD